LEGLIPSDEQNITEKGTAAKENRERKRPLNNFNYKKNQSII